MRPANSAQQHGSAMSPRPSTWLVMALVAVMLALGACAPGNPSAAPSGSTPIGQVAPPSGSVSSSIPPATTSGGPAASSLGPESSGTPNPAPSGGPVPPTPIPSGGLFGSQLLPGMPPILVPTNIYSADAAGNLSSAVQGDRPWIYVPNAGSSTVTEIDPATYRVMRTFAVGRQPQHIVPSWDLKTLWVTSELGNTLTPINPKTGLPGRPVPVTNPYNLYFTPNGRFAIVVVERLQRLDFRSPHTMQLIHPLLVPCPGVDHGDFSANGRLFVLSCEFGSRLLVVDVAGQRTLWTITIPNHGQPQDVKLSPDGTTFFVSDLVAGGVWLLDATTLKITGFIRTGAGAHGLYVSRDAHSLYVANRGAGSVSVISFATRRVTATWRLPGGGSPDMGNVSADGKVLWLSGRYNGVVYAINTTTGRLIRRIPVGSGPHGVCVWPQPGRYSLGHTGILR